MQKSILLLAMVGLVVCDYQKTIFQGVWGNWLADQKGKAGSYACGAQMRVERPQGRGDDSAANGLKLFMCKGDVWNTQEELMIYQGIWGDWQPKAMCDSGSYIIGGQVRFEDPIDGDDSALNGLRIRCKNPSTGQTNDKLVSEGYWGAWKPWYVDSANYVNGAQMRFEGNQGRNDDTAMNGLNFDFTPLKILKTVTYSYDLTKKVANKAPKTASSVMKQNTQRQVQVTTLSYEVLEQQENTWFQEKTIAYDASVSASFTVPIPNIMDVSGTTTLSTTTINTVNQGTIKTTSSRITHTEQVSIDPCTTTQVSVVIWQGDMNIPFVATYTFTDGTSQNVSGTWYGTKQFDVDVNTDTIKSCTCQDPVTKQPVCASQRQASIKSLIQKEFN